MIGLDKKLTKGASLRYGKQDGLLISHTLLLFLL